MTCWCSSEESSKVESFNVLSSSGSSYIANLAVVLKGLRLRCTGDPCIFRSGDSFSSCCSSKVSSGPLSIFRPRLIEGIFETPEPIRVTSLTRTSSTRFGFFLTSSWSKSLKSQSDFGPESTDYMSLIMQLIASDWVGLAEIRVGRIVN